jgi:putative addiction module antidote
MTTTLKITTVGNSAGIVLPREILNQLQVEKGDTLYATSIPGGGIKLTPYSEEFATQLEAGKRVMRKYRDALRKLAE